MRLGILGPLLVVDDAGREIRVAAARQRTLLAALLVRANRIVPVDELAEIVWDTAPPPGAAGTLRAYLTRLRQVVGPQIAARIETRDPGYLIRMAEPELDVLRFEALCRQTGAALRAGVWAEASTAATAAVELWRDEPLLDVPVRALREQCVPQYEQLRLQAVEDGIEAQLRLGMHGRLTAQLRELTAVHPLRERLHGQLMLTLYRSGRRAEALAAYQDARRVLCDELGVEPGPELRRLRQRIMDDDDTLAAPDPNAQPPSPESPSSESPSSEPAEAVVPRQLPAGTRHFTGRQDALDHVHAVLNEIAQGSGAGAPVVISAIDGMAGVGKTALAVHAAHQLVDRFPDGQLFIDLHGHTQGYPPREPIEALETLLRAMDVAPARIPADLDERAALYRQHLVDTRTLIVLDNAFDEAQVRPLLPGAAGCLVLVTSRRRLKGLHDAHVVTLDVLSDSDARALLEAVVGPARAAGEDIALTEIVELCGRLPLALRMAAALLCHRPAWSLRYLADLLRDQQKRLAALADGEHDLRAVFDLSYSGLDDRHRMLLRRLGLVSGPDVDVWAVAALTGLDPQPVARVLEDLVDHNLLVQPALGRYRMHDLIRAYARDLSAADSPADRERALERLLCYYAHTAQRASILIARYPRAEPDGSAPVHSPALADPEAARAWLRTERENLDAAYAHARASGQDKHVLALTAGLAEILRTDGTFTRALALHQAAAEAAQSAGWPVAHATALAELGIVRRLTGNLPGADQALGRALEIYRALGDRPGEATVRTELGIVRHLTGDLSGAGDTLTQALKVFQAIGHRNGEATALTELGSIRRLTGDLSGAAEVHAQALEIYRALGHRHGEAAALTDLGRVRQTTGELSVAADALAEALAIQREIGHRHGEATALTDLGAVRRLTGDLPGAADALAEAVAIQREIGHRNGEATALAELAVVRRLTGDLPGATSAVVRALNVFRATGNRNNEAWALNYYAAIVAATGNRPGALVLYRQSLSMNRALNKPDDEAAALEGLGECELSTGEAEAGPAHLRESLKIYQRLGMARDARRVRDRLAGLARAPGDPSRCTGSR